MEKEVIRSYKKKKEERIKISHSELRISSQAVELFRRVFFSPSGGCLAEAGGDLIKCSALGLRHFKEGEDEEHQQEDSEDDEDIRSTQLL